MEIKEVKLGVTIGWEGQSALGWHDEEILARVDFKRAPAEERQSFIEFAFE